MGLTYRFIPAVFFFFCFQLLFNFHIHLLHYFLVCFFLSVFPYIFVAFILKLFSLYLYYCFHISYVILCRLLCFLLSSSIIYLLPTFFHLFVYTSIYLNFISFFLSADTVTAFLY
jgi:hypothetical protein